MEELAGGRNESVLPYAVKDHFIYLGERINVIASEVYVEIENKSSDAVTFRRAIRDNQRNSKLIDVLKGPYLTGGRNRLAFNRLTCTTLAVPKKRRDFIRSSSSS
jgi:hypothetical protein